MKHFYEHDLKPSKCGHFYQELFHVLKQANLNFKPALIGNFSKWEQLFFYWNGVMFNPTLMICIKENRSISFPSQLSPRFSSVSKSHPSLLFQGKGPRVKSIHYISFFRYLQMGPISLSVY
jgi:hypothetical protein